MQGEELTISGHDQVVGAVVILLALLVLSEVDVFQDLPYYKVRALTKKTGISRESDWQMMLMVF